MRKGEGEGRGSRKGGKEGRKRLEVGRGREAGTVPSALHWGLMRPPARAAASPSLWRLPMVAGVLLRINQMMPQTFSL